MPRSPEVCSSVFCPLKQATRSLWRIVASHPVVASIFLRAVSGALLLLILFIFQLSLMTVFGQDAPAARSGTVTDQNNAVVAGIEVTIIHITHGFQSSATTNREGIVVAPMPPPRVAYTDLSLWPPSKRAAPAIFRRELTSTEPAFQSAHDLVFGLVVAYALCSLVLALARLLAEDMMITTLVFVNGWRTVQKKRTKRQKPIKHDHASKDDNALPSEADKDVET